VTIFSFSDHDSHGKLEHGIIGYPLEREREMIEFFEPQLMKPISRHG
jgi:hypothetical protein